MHSSTRSPLTSLARAIAVAIAAAALFAVPATASASPSAMKVAFVKALYTGDTTTNVEALLRAFPGIASVDVMVASDGGHVTAADLAPYDAAVVAGNSNMWTDSVELGNAAASVVDRGGAVVLGMYTAWEDATPGWALKGKFADAGYNPFQNQTDPGGGDQLGSFNTNPIFTGVYSFTEPWTYPIELAPGATQLAHWAADSTPAVAIKGSVLAYNGWIGDIPAAAGHDVNVARIVGNALSTLGQRDVTVALAGSGKGTIAGPAGTFACAAICVGALSSGSSASLTAKAAKGSAFTGWSGACAGTAACALKIGYPGTSSADWNTAALTANFASAALASQKFKNGKLQVKVPGAGALQIKAGGIKSIKVKAKKAGLMKFKLKLTGSLKRKLAAGKSVKVKFKFAFTPTGAAAPANSSKSLKLKLS